MFARPYVWMIVTLFVGAPPASAQPTSDADRVVITGPFGSRADSVLQALAARGFSGVALVAPTAANAPARPRMPGRRVTR